MTATIPPVARIGTGELAAIVGCSRGYVARQCARGEFPCTVVAGRYRFTLDDVTAILARTRREPRERRRSVDLGFADLPRDATRITPARRRVPLDVHRYASMGNRQ